MKVLLVGEGPNELGGALETLVRRMGLADAEIVSDQVKRSNIHVHHGKGQGYFKKAVRWMREAEKRGFDALVLVIDHDNRPERLQELANAQQHNAPSIRRALGVAIRTFDAWMLADEKALTTVLGYGVPRQKTPERNSDPKEAIRGLCQEAECSMSLSEIYKAIAKEIDVNVLHQRCPKGFSTFAQRVRGL